jgi:nucleotide-binding universal stress UspA family protein
MNFRSLLVVLDADARCDARTRLAASFAAAHGSHVIGIAPTGRMELPESFAASRSMEDASVAQADAIHRAGGWVDRFRECCRVMGATSVEADVHEGDKAAVVLHHAHCADLTVIGQADPQSPSNREDKRFVEDVLLHNARPTLVVPNAGRFDRVGENVLIAWDDSHGCARATADALPLLRHAGRVFLRTWRRADEGMEARVHERLQAVRSWLMRQRVVVDLRVITTDAPIGDAILEHALELNADLVVMGTYGHSPWTERILGGATRTALARASLPLLMSH